MKTLHKWIILVGLLFAALVSYSYGFSQGATFFIVVGVVLELTFWIGIFGKKRQSNEPPHN